MKNQYEFQEALTELCAKHGIGEGWDIPEHIVAHRIVQWLDSGMPEIELKNEPEETAEDTVPSVNIGSEVKINNVAFIVTDFHNSFDAPARASLMSIHEIRQRTQQGRSRRGYPPYTRHNQLEAFQSNIEFQDK